jgi:hypothetical protein
MSATDYFPPVSHLLTRGRPKAARCSQWPNYVKEYGLTDADVPELIQLAVEDELDWQDDFECYAPIHACRAIGQLRAKSAIQLMIALLADYDNDWLMEELPAVFGMIGPASIPALSVYLKSTQPSVWSKVAASGGLEQIASRHPEYRDECVALITEVLSQHQHQPSELNGNLVGRLLDLQAVESVDVIERAYKEGPMDEMVCGSWARVQIELGLATIDDFTAEELRHKEPEWMDDIKAIAALRELSEPEFSTTRKLTDVRPGLSQFGQGSLSTKGRKSSPAKSGFGTQQPKKKKKKRKR